MENESVMGKSNDDLKDLLCNERYGDEVIKEDLEYLIFTMENEEKLEEAWRAFIGKENYKEQRVSLKDIFKLI